MTQISETFHIVVGRHISVDVEIADNRKTGGHECIMFDETSKFNKKVSVRMFVLFRRSGRYIITSFMEFPYDETSTSVSSKDFISSRRFIHRLPAERKESLHVLNAGLQRREHVWRCNLVKCVYYIR